MAHKLLAKYVNCSPERLLECHLNIVAMSTSRMGLISAYKAAKLSLGPGKSLEQVIAACAGRQQELLEKGVISL